VNAGRCDAILGIEWLGDIGNLRIIVNAENYCFGYIESDHVRCRFGEGSRLSTSSFKLALQRRPLNDFKVEFV